MRVWVQFMERNTLSYLVTSNIGVSNKFTVGLVWAKEGTNGNVNTRVIWSPDVQPQQLKSLIIQQVAQEASVDEKDISFLDDVK